MHGTTSSLSELLGTLAQRARQLGFTDSEWAARAGVRKETLSRLRRRYTCDFATLRALAEAVRVKLGVWDVETLPLTADGHFPVSMNREYEERLVALCVSQTLDTARWANTGPAFFMAGLAVMLASVRGYDRRGLLELAERLHPGASEPAVFTLWLARSPLRPSRFLPQLEIGAKHAA